MFPGIFLVLCACTGSPEAELPRVVAGQLDLRSWDFATQDPVSLDGEWEFFGQAFISASDAQRTAPTYLAVPGRWKGAQIPGGKMAAEGFGSYRMYLQLPKSADPGLFFPEFWSAYELEVDGKVLASNGTIGTTSATTVAHFAPRLVRLPDTGRPIELIVRGANFRGHRGGFIHRIRVGNYDDLFASRMRTLRMDSFLFGALILSGLIHLFLFLFRTQARYHLYFGLSSLTLALHILWLSDRTMYVFTGPGYWMLNMRLEMVTVLVSLFASAAFFRAFMPKVFPKWHFRATRIGFALLFAWVLVSPASVIMATQELVPLVPSIYLLSHFGLTIWGIWKRETYAMVIMAFNVILITGLLYDGSILGNPVKSVQTAYYGILIFVCMISFLTARQSGMVYSHNEALSTDLQAANQRLARHNEELEQVVAERTAQLVEAEKQTLALQLEKQQRDMESLGATNKMIHELTRNMIDDLRRLPESEEDLPRAIRQLIGRLNDQLSIHEKTNLLHQDPELVNAAFYERLETRYPQLRKSERELCAYIKLGLSSKEMATVKQTSLNTINVTRYRIRKKLGLEKGTDLDTFIRQI